MVSAIYHKNIGAYSLDNVWDSVWVEVNTGSEWEGGCHDGAEATCPLPLPLPPGSG